MSNNLFNVLDHVMLCSDKKPITSYPGNMEHKSDRYEFIDRLVILLDKITPNFETYGDPIGQYIILNINDKLRR